MKAPRLININLGVRTEEKVVEDPNAGKPLDEDQYWRLGTGRVGGRDLAVERKKTLEGFEYRLAGTLINASSVECWSAREYIEWRDG